MILQHSLKKWDFRSFPCNLCGSQENLVRKRVKKLIDQLAQENLKVPSNILHALTSIKPSQLMDKKFWDFKNLEQQKTVISHDEIQSGIDEFL